MQQHFRGGKGNDTITTDCTGDQSYHYDRGDGQDTYVEGNGQNDRIVFGHGISLADLSVNLEETILYVGLKQNDGASVSQFADRIRIASWASDPTYQIEKLEFADGTTFDLAADWSLL